MNAPQGYTPMTMEGNAFLNVNGPFYCRREGKAMVIGLRVEERHCNAMNVAHGGLVMSFADLMLTACLNYQSGLSRFLLTVSASCDFAGPAKLGEWIEGRAELLRVTRTMVFGQGRITTQTGELVARASGVLKYSGEPDPRFGPTRYLPTED